MQRYLNGFNLFLKTSRELLEISIVICNIGTVADDNIYQTIRFYETGVFSGDETIKRLKTEVLFD